MRKRAFTLIEVSAAIVLLAVCAVCFAQLYALVTAERANARTRQTAVDLLLNVMERFDTDDFDKTPFESLIERSLPDGKIEFEAKTVENNNVIATVTISWNASDKQPRRKVSMFRLYQKTSEI